MPAYFKRRWDETPGGEQDSWGESDWYFETDEHGNVLRQIEVYDHGPTLRYDRKRPLDAYGQLSDQPLDLVEFAPYALSAEGFEQAWNAADPRPP